MKHNQKHSGNQRDVQPLVVQGQPVYNTPGYSQLEETDIEKNNTNNTALQVEINSIELRITSEFGCYSCLLVTFGIISCMSIIYSVTLFDPAHVIAILTQSFQAYTFYIAYNARKDRDLEKQRTATKFLKILFIVNFVLITLALLIFVGGASLLAAAVPDDVGNDAGNEQIAQAGNFVMIGVAIFASLVCCFGVGVPFYMYNQCRKVLILMERRNEIMLQLNGQRTIPLSSQNL